MAGRAPERLERRDLSSARCMSCNCGRDSTQHAARVRGLQGDKVYSASSEVCRDVIQGDIISPIFFILAMKQIFLIHDKSPAEVEIGNYLQIGILD